MSILLFKIRVCNKYSGTPKTYLIRQSKMCMLILHTKVSKSPFAGGANRTYFHVQTQHELNFNIIWRDDRNNTREYRQRI